MIGLNPVLRAMDVALQLWIAQVGPAALDEQKPTLLPLEDCVAQTYVKGIFNDKNIVPSK